jgi:type III secretion protein Q
MRHRSTQIFASICRDTAAAYSQVARHGADFEILLHADGDRQPSRWRIGFSPLIPDAVHVAASIHVLLDWSGARVWVGIPPAACHAWLSAALPQIDIGFPSGWMLDAAVESMMADIAATLAASIDGADLHVVAHDSELAERDCPHQWAVTVQALVSDSLAVITLKTDDLGLALLADALSRREPENSGIDLDTMMLPLRVSVGTTAVQAAELRDARTGDVIILDQCLLGPAGALWLGMADGRGFRVGPAEPAFDPAGSGAIQNVGMPGLADAASSSSFVVIEGWSLPMSQTTTNEFILDTGNVQGPVQEDARESLDITTIPVRLTFDMGEQTVMLSELRRLQPGHVFQLSTSVADGPVFIRANGSCVGAGELVDVDGRVGVRILRLQHASP